MLNNQTKPLICFDLEATGLKVSEARIIQIAATRIEPGCDNISQKILHTVNPNQNIDEYIVELTGVSNEEAAASPSFKDIAQEVYEFFKGCDFIGYNLMRFDVPLLAEEFARIDMEHPFGTDTKFIDVQSIFHQREPRDLSGAVRHYLNKEHTDAHDAMGDTVATLEVLKAQLRHYSDLPNDLAQLHALSMRGKEYADPSGLFYFDDKRELHYKFGKYRDQPVHPYDNYLQWMMNTDFPICAKDFIRRFIDGEFDKMPGQQVSDTGTQI